MPGQHLATVHEEKAARPIESPYSPDVGSAVQFNWDLS